MPRPLRPIADGLVYPVVINRGNNRQTVFDSEGDFRLPRGHRRPEGAENIRSVRLLPDEQPHSSVDPPARSARSAASCRACWFRTRSATTASITAAATSGRATQEPGDSGRRPPLDGVAVHRSQPIAGEAGGARGRLSVEQFRLSRPGAERSAGGPGRRLRGVGGYAAVRQRRWSAYVHPSRRRRSWRPSAAAARRACPTASTDWVNRLSRQLKLDLTIRPRGRPRKDARRKIVLTPFSSGKVKQKGVRKWFPQCSFLGLRG